jgi:hypothetical protein
MEEIDGRIDFSLVSRLYLRNPCDRRFKEHFGHSARTVGAVWWFLWNDENQYLRRLGAKPMHLLWWYHWVTVYNTEGVCAEFCKTNRTTFRSWVEVIEEAISQLDVIRWEDRHDGGIDTLAKVSIDGTDGAIQEVYPFDPELYSYKLNAAGLRYEIGICIATGLIVWVNGPYKPAKWPDLKIFRDAMIHALDIGEWIVADGGYNDGFQFVIPKRCGPLELQLMTARAGARHETVNARIKIFGVLHEPFRHGLNRHGSVFNAIANVVQISLMVESPLFTVAYDDRPFRGFLEFRQMLEQFNY